MKTIINLILILTTVTLISFPSISGATPIIFQDDFNAGTFIDADTIYSTNRFVKAPWSIENGVLITGYSTLHRDVHYQHFVDVRYFSADILDNFSISLFYIFYKSISLY